jgi:gentisate 1,2-dioxygenase
MSMTKPTDTEHSYSERTHTAGLAPLWEFFHDWFSTLPRVKAVPQRWRYDDLRPLLLEAEHVVTAADAERRVLALENRALEGERLVVDSLYAGLQLIVPGETAPAHRHTAAALRYIIEGSGAYTSVNGERAYMHPGDFIVTPSWAWHEHCHGGQGPMVWLDVLDVPMTRFLGAGFSEKYPEDVYPESAPPGSSLARFGANMRPVDAQDCGPNSPLFAYPYKEALTALRNTAASGSLNAHHAVKMEYINPANGSSAMPTISTFLQFVPSGFVTRHYRSTAAAVICIVEGRGRLLFGAGETAATFDFQPRDLFAWPSWVPLAIESDSDAVIFTASTQAAQRALGIWREAFD